MLINDDFINVHLDRKADLFLIDPPYGQIVSDKYDHLTEMELLETLYELLDWMGSYSYNGTSAYIFGGTGKYKNRPFFRFAYELEHKTKWRIANFITWKKRRGFGTQRNWMYCREEILFLVYNAKYPKHYTPQYTSEERSDEWKKRLSNKKYKPKTNNLRYSNVICDINEIFRNQWKDAGCLVSAEKPVALYELLLNTSCPEDGYVVDPMCGSGTTGIAYLNTFKRHNFLCIEKDPLVYNLALNRIDQHRIQMSLL